MDLNKDNKQNKIAEIRAKQVEKELEKIINLADKNIGLSIFWSIVHPVTGYLYTGRWRAFGFLIFSLISLCGWITITADNTNNGFENATAFFIVASPVASAIDNSFAIKKSKEKLSHIS